MDQNNVLSAKNLNKIYKKKSLKSIHALNNLNLEVKRGEIFGLLGPNGAGKSTFINILGGLCIKSSGQVNVWGFDLDKNPRQVRASIGIVPQEINVDPFFSPKNLLDLQAGLYGVKKKDRITETILELVSLKNQENSYSRSLSGGMKRRLLIAKALVHQPPIVILDEPTAGVDVELRQSLWKNLHDLKKNGVTIFLTTHYIEEAERLADRVGIIHQGEILMVEKKDKILEKLGDKRVIITINKTSKNLKNILIKYNYQKKKNKLIFSLDLKNNRNSVSELFKDLIKNSISFNDVEIKKNNLEEIFLKLIDQ